MLFTITPHTSGGKLFSQTRSRCSFLVRRRFFFFRPWADGMLLNSRVKGYQKTQGSLSTEYYGALE